MRLCLCKECDYVNITTWNDTPKYKEVLFCQCCGGTRLIPYPWKVTLCPNRRRRLPTSAS